ncbi:putative Ig domain-containing protein [Ramlibacter sp. WS9]|uniref:putative Ig domain-containing protein n=1 Tax=Ramlibacter sp. WS9 TaxID=1882741 RepID=UPI00130515B3|nr:putative Ig domain-containing protein [Ramlibacter sp. WS9]
MTLPVLIKASPTMTSVAEGATNPAGMTVAALAVDETFIDENGRPSVEAIAIEAVNTSLGTWQYSLNGGTDWLTIRADLINSSTNTLALLLGPTDMIRLLPFGDLNGSMADAVTFRSWNMGTGSAGNYVVTTPGVEFFSFDSDTASITVTAVNDAPTFAPVQGTGKAIIPVGGSDDEGRSVTVQPDGKIIVAGRSLNGNNDFSLVRLNANGSLDSTFGGSPAPGKAIIPVGDGDDVGYSVTVQPDGKIIVAGNTSNGIDNDFSLVRLNADGSLDSTFGGSPAPGKAIIPVGGDDQGQSVTVQPDGKIIVAGYSDNGSNYDFSLVRLNANGSLDSTFGGSPAPGKAIIPVGSSYDYGYSVTVQPDGKIVMAGSSMDGNYDLSLVRLNADGTLDTSFGGPATNTLGGTASFTEGGAAVALDTSVAIFDVELAALDAGAGNYAGASVTLQRTGTPNADDVFSALGNLSLAGGNAVLDAVTVGTFTQAGGVLTITFNTDATQARVDEVLSSLAYANTSDAPPASVVIDYVFDDGNDGSQGSGGALSTTGSVTVNITAGDDTPTLNQAIADQQATEDTSFSFQFAAGTFVDPDGDALTYSATLFGGGALPAWLTFDGTTRTFSGTPGNGDVGTLSVTVTASDGAGPTASDTFDIAVANTNDAPTGGATISGIPGLGHVLTAVTTTLADADGLAPLHYTWLRNGVAIAGAPDAVTYKAGLADFGATLSVRVSYTDLGGTAESVISAPTSLIGLAGPPPGMNPVSGGTFLNILKGTAGGDWFTGGLGIDWVTGGAGDDIYFVNSLLDFVVEAPGGGTDLVISSALAWILPANVENLLLNGPLAYIGTGNALNNVIVGSAGANNLYGLDGADTLRGLGGADWLEGGNGDDVLVGGLGRDTLVGGAGRDVMVFDVAPGTANADTIRGFSAPADTIELVRDAGFQALAGPGTLAASAFVIGRFALGAEDRIMYDRASGNLYYDADGTGAIGAVQIATLMGSPELTNQDIVVV